MDTNKLEEFKRLSKQIETNDKYLARKQNNIVTMQTQLREGVIPGGSPQALSQTMKNVLPWELQPGNLGNINDVIWPFKFPTGNVIVAPQSQVTTSFTITQEAGFSWMSFVKTVFKVDGGGNYVYVDPDQPGDAGQSYGLSFTVKDSQSTRSFEDDPTDVNTCGNPRWPTKSPRPMLILPNANIQISWFNEHATQTYAPQLIAFGYRLRMQDAQNILSLITA